MDVVFKGAWQGQVRTSDRAATGRLNGSVELAVPRTPFPVLVSNALIVTRTLGSGALILIWQAQSGSELC